MLCHNRHLSQITAIDRTKKLSPNSNTRQTFQNLQHKNSTVCSGAQFTYVVYRTLKASFSRAPQKNRSQTNQTTGLHPYKSNASMFIKAPAQTSADSRTACPRARSSAWVQRDPQGVGQEAPDLTPYPPEIARERWVRRNPI